MKSSRGSPHSSSDRFLQAQVWRGFGLRKVSDEKRWPTCMAGTTREILPPLPRPMYLCETHTFRIFHAGPLVILEPESFVDFVECVEEPRGLFFLLPAAGRLRH